jgi:hypothetical protein
MGLMAGANVASVRASQSQNQSIGSGVLITSSATLLSTCGCGYGRTVCSYRAADSIRGWLSAHVTCFPCLVVPPSSEPTMETLPELAPLSPGPAWPLLGTSLVK